MFCICDRNNAEVWSVIQDLVLKVEDKLALDKKMHVKKVCTIKYPSVKYGREATWRFCAIICCFYHHPMLGRKSDILASRTFNIKSSTIRGWAKNIL